MGRNKKGDCWPARGSKGILLLLLFPGRAHTAAARRLFHHDECRLIIEAEEEGLCTGVYIKKRPQCMAPNVCCRAAGRTRVKLLK